MKRIGLIPSRYKSTRFEGKPLSLIEDIPMFCHVYYRSRLSSLDSVYICTDDSRIYDIAKKKDINVLMTSESHQNGTERCHEAIDILKLDEDDVVVDIQGDEPLIDPILIDDVITNFIKFDADVLFPYLSKVKKNDIGSVKVLTNSNNNVLYMSRSDIPNPFRNQVPLKKQVGLIAFTVKSLKEFCNTKLSELENIEGIELLRVFETNLKMKTFETNFDSKSVDYPEDLEIVRELFKKDIYISRYKDLY